VPVFVVSEIVSNF